MVKIAVLLTPPARCTNREAAILPGARWRPCRVAPRGEAAREPLRRQLDEAIRQGADRGDEDQRDGDRERVSERRHEQRQRDEAQATVVQVERIADPRIEAQHGADAQMTVDEEERHEDEPGEGVRDAVVGRRPRRLRDVALDAEDEEPQKSAVMVTKNALPIRCAWRR